MLPGNLNEYTPLIFSSGIVMSNSNHLDDKYKFEKLYIAWSATLGVQGSAMGAMMGDMWGLRNDIIRDFRCLMQSLKPFHAEMLDRAEFLAQQCLLYPPVEQEASVLVKE